MLRGLIISGTTNFGLEAFWLGLHIEQYGCQGIGQHGLKIALELGFVEFMLCIGKKY